MRTIVTAARVALGGYLAAHGAQKLFGSFNGPGLDAAAQGFESMGLKPGRQYATAAGATELAGGVLTATGIAHPLGPLMIANTMSVAAAVHRKGGPFAQDGGYELPVINLAFAGALAALRPAGIQLGPSLPKKLTAVVALGGAAAAGYVINKLLNAETQSPEADAGAAGDAASTAEPELTPASDNGSAVTADA